MKVSVIIIHWNTPELLKKQLTLLKPSANLEIIVVDNKSDKPIDWINKELPNIKLIKNGRNLGYAAACNTGAKEARGYWLLFLNPDIIITNDQISQMINEAESSGLDAASPNPRSSDYQKPLPTPFSLLAEFTPLNKLYNLKNFTTLRTLFGGCLLIKKSVLEKLSGWNEQFFLWFEDSDLTKRLYDNGYNVGWLETNVDHLGGASFALLDSKSKRKIFFTSMNLYAKKHFSIFGRLIVYLIKLRYTL